MAQALTPYGVVTPPTTTSSLLFAGGTFSIVAAAAPIEVVRWFDRQSGRIPGLIGLAYGPFNSRNY